MVENHPNYLKFSDSELLNDCRVETFRSYGSGGQKRNKTDSAVRLTHAPTGITSQAFEDRSQHRNRSRALVRLRETIALSIRRPVRLDGYTPPPELQIILPNVKWNRIGRHHRSYPAGIQVLLDLFFACDCSISETAAHVGISTGSLSRMILADSHLLHAVNKLRLAADLHPLR